jgi:ABC-type antimicrobial peptide transport system permease subunit
MILNFFTVALRNFFRSKILSFIHIVGLATGMSASLIIFLIVHYENTFDKFEPDPERIYRVVMDVRFNGVDGHGSAVPAPLANAVEAEVTGVDAVVPVMTFQGDANANVAFNNGKDQVIKGQSDIVFTKPDYFEMIPFDWVIGSPESSLSAPFSVVLTEERAKLYFPNLALNDVVGKQLTYNELVAATVTGVVKDLNETTDFTAKEFISYSTIAKTKFKDDFMMEVWNDWMAYSTLYLKLSPNNDKDGVVRQLNEILGRQRKNDESANKWAFVLQPLNDIHFNYSYIGFNQRVANRSTMTGLMIIAGFLLLLACINFTNLATAQASQRAKEIAIRKSIGSSRGQLLIQFLSETFCMSLAAAVLSMACAPLLLDLFSDFIPKGVTFAPLSNSFALAFLISLVVAVTLIAGTYPSIVLSGLRPASILKGQRFIQSSTRTASLRKALIVFQFMIAQVFVFGAFIVSKQIHFSLESDPGYSREAIVYFEVPRMGDDHRDQLTNELRTMPGVSMMSLGFLPPAIPGAAFGNITFNKNGEEIKENVQVRWGDPQYIDVYKIGIVAGRNVRSGENIHELLINETYSKLLGFTDPSEALGQEVMNRTTPYRIVGVMKDFREGSTHVRTGPIVFMNNTNSWFIHIALLPQREQWTETLAMIGATYKRFYPGSDFNYTFFDDSIARFYQEEQNTSRLLNWAMGLSILTSCLGLLGLVIHTSEIRTKEIGIRKVLGASVSNLVYILSSELVKLVVIAFAVTVPLCWYGADKWLEGFAYRTEINWWVFGLSGVALIAVALITISSQTIRTATGNPIDSLRTE